MRRNVYELFCRRARGIPESASRSNFREFTTFSKFIKHAAIQHNIIYQKTVMHFLFLGLMAAALVVAGSAEWSPYELIPGWTYHLEASRGQADQRWYSVALVALQTLERTQLIKY